MVLTHWGRVTHICVGKLAITSSDNGLSPGRSEAIIWINAAILLIGPLWTNFSKIVIEIHIFPFKKMHFKMSSGYLRPCFAASMCLWHIGTGIRESTSKVFCSPSCCLIRYLCHDDVIKWKHFPCYWPFVRWSGEFTGLSEHRWPSTQPGSLHTALQRKYTQPCLLFSRGTAVWTMVARLFEQWGTAVCKCPVV